MNKSNERRAAFLGMPFGTAAHRLRKIVLFDLLRRHNENVCYRCSKEIESVEELSLEHKQPWEGLSVELFWDLANIAFSHLNCNSQAKRPSSLQKYFTPEEKLTAKREQTARSMRNNYTTERRRDKKERTGW